MAAGLLAFAVLSANAQYEFVREFGQRGNQPGEFAGLRDITFAPNGDLIIADASNRRLQRCNLEGVCSELTGISPPVNNFSPNSVAADNDGHVIASHITQIAVCALSGETSCDTTVFGGSGNTPGRFSNDLYVATSSDDRIIVSDRGNNRLQVCGRDGQCSYLGDATPIEFQTPGGVTVDSQDRILVTESFARGVRICTLEGVCDGFTDQSNLIEINRIAVDHAGRILVARSNSGPLQVCDYEGNCAPLETTGGGPDDFLGIKGMATDGKGYLAIALGQAGARQEESILIYRDRSFQINPGLNDAWFNALTAGQGFFIIVFEDTGIVFMAWFTYDTELPPEDVIALLGAAEHRWLTAQGSYEGDTATLDVFLTEGGIFDMEEPAPTTGESIGTIIIVWTDCENGVLTYDIDPPGVMGEIPIKRIVPDNVALCEALSEQ